MTLNKYRKLFLFMILFLCYPLLQNLKAQNMIIANPAKMYDIKSAFVNPAILTFQKAHAAIGGKIFHLGFMKNRTIPFRQGFVSVGLPFGINNLMGLGIQIQHFNTPLFTQSNISVGIARKFHRIFSFGIKLNIFNKSFNSDNFDLVDEDDPVFANGATKWSSSIGAGISMIPYNFLSIGIGIDHINRSNISLINDSMYQPFKGYLGATLSFGMVLASISASYEEEKLRHEIMLGSSLSQTGYFMIGFNERDFQLEGQLRISGPLSFNYSYDYTLFDNEGFSRGSHQVTIMHEFDRKRELPKFEMPDEFVLEFEPPEKQLMEEPKFHIYSTTSKLDIIDKKLTRIVDPDLNKQALAELTISDLGILDSTRTEEYFPFDKDTVDIEGITAVFEMNLSDGYRSFIQNVNSNLNRNKEIKTQIITSQESVLRAAGLKKYLQKDSDQVTLLQPVYNSQQDSIAANQKLGTLPVKQKETLTVLSSYGTTFKIMPVLLINFVQKWKLVITDSRGTEAKRFAGNGLPPDQLQWDWQDHSGNLITPGLYDCYLEWLDNKNQQHRSNKSHISVQKIIRNITIEVTNKQKQTGVDADEINILLKK